MDIFYEGTKRCKKCGRDLPHNSLYYPTDKTSKTGLRNVCRECNPKYKRFLEVGHRTNEEWSNEDLELLKTIYKDYSNQEIIDNHFPNRTIRAIESIASKHGFNHKSDETLDRIRKEVATTLLQCKKGRKFSDEARQKFSEGQRKRYENESERERARQNALNRELWQGENHPRKLDPLYGERNGRWKGGSSDLIEQLRRDIIEWKKSSSEFCDYKCIITGNRFDNIHHLISFNSIVEDSITELNLDRRKNISDYSDSEYQALRNLVIKKHTTTLYGACLCKKIHELFHKEFTYYDSTVVDFVKFINEIIQGKYDDYFLENNLNKNIDTKYMNYLESTLSELGLSA